MEANQFTISSTPPSPQRTQRRSRWAELLEECRDHRGEWRRLMEPMTKSTATQVASDLRNASHRDPAKSRVRGLRVGESWEAKSGHDPADTDPDHWYVWLRFEAPTETTATATRRRRSTKKA
jgi:hypothetical protein